MTAGRARLYLALSAALCFAVLAYLSAAHLSPGDHRPFDTAWRGYDQGHAAAYLAALDPYARAIYAGPFRVIDTLFPILLAAFLALALHGRTRGWGLVPQLLLLIFPGGYLVMDLTENALVAQIVGAGAEGLDAKVVALASGFTITKYVLLGATLAALAAAFVLGERR